MRTTIRKTTALITIMLLTTCYNLKTYNTKNYVARSGNFLQQSHIPALVSALYLATISNNKIKQTLKKQLEPKKLFHNFVKEYSLHLAVTVAHEVGHTVTSKIFSNHPANIIIGGKESAQTILKLPGIKFKYPMDPMAGWCRIETSFGNNKIKDAIIYLSGGGFGILSYALIENSKKHLMLMKKKNISLKDIIINKVVANELFNALIPINQTSDASKIWRHYFNVSKRNIQLACDIEPFLYHLFLLYITHEETTNSSATILDKIAITFINYRLKGFFNFNL